MDSEPISVSVVGFSDFERELLLTYLRHGGRRQLRYRAVANPEAAEFLVVDGDQHQVVDVLARLGRLRDAVLVGGVPSDDAAAWLMRPLTPEQVLGALDEQRQLRESPESTSLPLPLGLPPSRPADLGWPTTMPSVAELPLRGGRRAHERRQDLAAVPDRPPATPAPAPQPLAVHAPTPVPATTPAARTRGKPLVVPRALVVDDSDIALHFMRRHLLPYDIQVDVARFAHQALELMAQRAYGLVFLDVDLGDGSGEDGLKLCRRVRHHFQHPGPRVPMVVMVSAFDSPVDQVRGTLAGAEAYLGKPLDPQRLGLLLRRLGFRARHLGTPAPAGADGLSQEAQRPPRVVQAPGAGD